MFRSWQLIFASLCVLVLGGCDDNTTFRSSVPTYPVRITIDTNVGPFVHFIPTASYSHIIVNEDGYFYDGEFIQKPLGMDAWGYAGVVVYINMMGGYDAYDLCCPNCVYERQACKVDGPFATCPLCGEQYTLGDGTAVPNKGIATEQLRRLNVMNSGGRLTITQRQ